MPNSDRSAVVIGASMSGLLAARALSTHFSRVSIIERDVLPDAADLRKGVPQAAHAHGLLASGYRVIDGFFPGIMDELEALGAPRGDVIGDFLWFQYGRWKLRHKSGLIGITVSRPCLESAVRRHVKGLANVSFLEDTTAVKPVFDAARGCVTGLMIRRRHAGEDATLNADLVVDASGRGSQSPKWLDEWGCGTPEIQSIRVDVGYATRTFERKPGDFFDSMGGIVAATPHSARMAAILAAEGNRWVITLAGSMGDHPPTDEERWMRFAASFPVPVVHELVSAAKPISTSVTSYKFPANQRRLYERMKRFPAGYLVVGDAVCSFNPIYGQGMSVAAAEAKTLDDCVPANLEGLADRFYRRIAKVIDIPWTIATGEDLRFPAVEGTRPPAFQLVNRYLDRVHASASQDAEVCRRFFDVLNLLAPPTSLFSPPVAFRVLGRSAPSGAGTPWGVLPPPPAPDSRRTMQ